MNSSQLKSFGVLFAVGIFSFAIAFGGGQSIDYGSAGPSSLFSSLADPTSSPTNSGSVNLYSGQHVESIPLLSLPGRGGLGVNLSLDYNGNVGHILKKENRVAQVSPFGLGFDIGRQSVVVDHRGTTHLHDDVYKLALGNTILDLKSVGEHDYITQRGDPWTITRHLDSVGSRHYVIGWTLVKENGTVYEFGDFTDSLLDLNSTRNIFHYGDHVGRGVTQDDSVYPFQWDIRKVHDPDTLNWIDYIYLREESHLTVIDPSDSSLTDTSKYRYTRSLLIDTIKTSAGSKIAFDYSKRDDFQQYLGVNNYEFYDTAKVSGIKLLNSGDQVVTQLSFTYDYLNDSRDSTLLKLTLKDVIFLDSSNADSLPPLSLTYDTDTSSISYGCITKMQYPTGSMKELLYSTVPDSMNFTQLDIQVEDSSDVDTSATSYGTNMYMSYDDGNMLTIGVWDGYWHLQEIAMSSTVNKVGVSNDLWGVVHFAYDSVAVIRWNNGYLQMDTLGGVIGTYGGTIRGIHTGRDCFLVVSGSVSAKNFKRAAFVVWNGSQWHYQSVAESGSAYYDYIGKVRDGNYIIHYGPTSSTEAFTYGAYDYTNDTIITSTSSSYSGSQRSPYSFDIGADFTTYISDHKLIIHRWTGTSWDSEYSFNVDGWRYMITVSAIDNGVVATHDSVMYDDPRYKGMYAHIDSWFFDAGGDPKHVSLQLNSENPGYDDSYRIGDMVTSNRTIATIYDKTANQNIWEWDGVGWVAKQVASTSAYRTVTLFPNSYYYDASKASRYSGGLNLTWDTQEAIDLSGLFIHGNVGVSEDFVTSFRSTNTSSDRFDTVFCSYRNAYYNDGDYTSYYVSDYLSKDSMYIDSNIQDFEIVGGADDFLVGERWWFDTTAGPPSPVRWFDAYLYKRNDTSFEGSAPLIVVSSVKLYHNSSDTNPIITTFDYVGGLLDQSGHTARFAQVRVSTPFFSNDSASVDGYTVHNFYNDIDDSSFYDTMLYTHAGRVFPDLGDSVRFGLENGGYRLDGIQYSQYTYNSNDVDSIIDSTWSYHKLVTTPDSVYDVYRVQVDSSFSYSEGFTDTVTYNYDFETGLLLSTTSRITDDSNYIIDSTSYAFMDGNPDSAVLSATHELTLPYEKLRILYDSSSATTVLSRSRTYYEKKGFHRPKKSFVWPDANASSDTADALKTFETMGSLSDSYDDAGNAIASKNAMGVVSSSKFDTTLTMPIASATNAKQSQWTLNTYEYGLTYDDWENLAGDSGLITSSEAFTGSSSYRLNNHSSPATTSYGPARTINAADVVGSEYYFSLWAKAASVSTSLSTEVVAYDDSGDSCATMLLSHTVPTTWTKIEGYFDFTDSCTTVDSVRLAFAKLTSFDTTIFLDDIRFHPVSVQVSSTAYDPVTRQTTSSSGANNYPARVFYDEFLRESGTANFDWDTLTQNFYSYVNDTHYDTTFHDTLSYDCVIESFVSAPDDGGENVDTIIAPADTFIYYYLYINADPGESCSLSVTSSITIESSFGDTLVWGGPFGVVDGHRAVSQGDTIIIRAYVDAGSGNGILCPAEATLDYCSSSPATDTLLSNPYSLPNYTASLVRQAPDSPMVAFTFFDGLGRTLQSRATNYVHYMRPDSSYVDTLFALVGGVASYDARGQVTHSYLPYYDMVGSTGVNSYSDWDSIIAEIREYYDGDPGPDCDTIPYTRNKYESTLKARLDSSLAPGATMLGKGSHFEYSFSTTDNTAVSKPIDPDSLESTSIKDRWGLFEKSESYLNSKVDTIVTISETGLLGDMTEMSIDTGQGKISLSKSYLTDIGREESVWRKGYGTIRMLYNRAGEIRFMQNDLRDSIGEFVYFKYDDAGRKIEEGLVTDSTEYTQLNADDVDFPEYPTDTAVTEVKYRWYYDHLPGSAPENSMGKLVRLENADSTYYKEYKYDPSGLKDTVYTKLPIPAGAVKRVIHEYNNDGSLARLTFRPDKDVSTGERVFEYEYDESGRMVAVRDGDRFLEELNYAEYTYNPDGGVDLARYGAYFKDDQTPVYDTIQIVQYTYDELGRLIAINDTGDIYDTYLGGMPDSLHFGLNMVFSDSSDTSAYMNGRPNRLAYAHSSLSGSKKVQEYEYTYNDLGWLTKADDKSGATDDREYLYNALGLRDTVFIDSVADTVAYEYDSDWRYLGPVGTSSQYQRKYDKLGNMIADSLSGIWIQTYDYRNQLTYSKFDNEESALNDNQLWFDYDEQQRRIRKQYTYWYYTWVGCGPPPMGPSGSGGPGEGPCPAQWTVETFYLYDQGMLLATFDLSDNIQETMINGPAGVIGYLPNTSSTTIYYHLKDQIGTPRVLMRQVLESPTSATAIYDYHPFGELVQSWISDQGNRFGFTGKERDEHGKFDYHYFGARYYDPTTGTFTSFDKASQFPGGFRYGNDPIIGVDPDGNLFFLSAPFLWSLATSVAVSATSYSITADDWSLGGLGRAVGGAALGTTLSGGLGSLGGSMARNFFYQAGSNVASSMATNLALSGRVSWQSAVGGGVGGLASQKMFGQFRPTGNNRLLNVGEEIAFGAVKGGTGSFMGGVATNALYGEQRVDLGQAFLNGAVSGAADGAASWAKYGTALKGPTNPAEEEALQDFLRSKNFSRPDFRTGGLVARWAYNRKPNSLGLYDWKFGGKVIISGRGMDAGTFIHETVHAWQHSTMGTSSFMSKIVRDHKRARALSTTTHTLQGTLEFRARWYQYHFSQKYDYPWVHGAAPPTFPF